jgi:hypothetical protein
MVSYLYYLFGYSFKVYRFRLKYHPEQGQQRRDERRQNLLKRQEVFNEMSLNGRFDGLALSFENAEQLIRLLNEGY